MRCLGCGYDLRGLPAHRCPECGRVFDPADPDTYEFPRLHGLPWAVTAWATLGASILLALTIDIALANGMLGFCLFCAALVILVRSGAVLFAPRSDIRRGDAWLLAFAAALIVVLGGLCVGSSALLWILV